jgi:uncharacterized protein (DUF302 family)
MCEQPIEIGIRVHMQQPYEEALERVKSALKTEGFGVLTEVDVKATMQAKLGVDFRKYSILGVCNPPLAYRALNTNLDVGLWLPCNVVVYEAEDEGCIVSLVDPTSMATMFTDNAFAEVAHDARQRFERVAAVLSGQ